MAAARVADFQQVSKSYPVYARPADRLGELLTFNLVRRHTDFWALRDLTFHIDRGETFCVIGENGAGKSTLLQVLAGILATTSGTARVTGKVAALLELGSGFNPEFSGRDNVYLNAAILGLTRKETDARFASIAEFAEIGEFIDQPVKTYSSGMTVRLAFAVAIHVDPEILLVDEALAVGDIYFRQRCMRKVHELRQRGITIVFVSHSMGDVKAIGDRTLWLDHGRLRELGPTDQVVTHYLAAMAEKDTAYLELKAPAAVFAASPAGPQAPPEVVTSLPNVDHRHGDGRGQILGIAVHNEYGTPIQLLEPDTRVVIRISARATQPIAHPNIGFMLRNHMGLDFAGSNTLREGHELPPMAPGDIVTVDFHLDLPTLYPTHFSLSPAIADGNLTHYKMCDWVDNAITLQMAHSGAGQGVWIFAPALPRRSQCAPCTHWSAGLIEFTGERVVPGQVDTDLWNEHLARYQFARRLARSRRVLDLACGTGYGAALLAGAATHVTGLDVSPDAIGYAREHYDAGNLRFLVSDATKIDLPDASFDLITAFELIEHLQDWRALLSEARRLLAHGGQFIVSTPNRLYYAETRAKAGPNPFHAHEFTYAEFGTALGEYFPHAALFVQNHASGVAFQPVRASTGADLKLESSTPDPEAAHFFIAVCAATPQVGGSSSSTCPRPRTCSASASSISRGSSKRWRKRRSGSRARKAIMPTWSRCTLCRKDKLEAANRWAAKLNSELEATGARVVTLQGELASTQAGAREASEAYEAQIASLQSDLTERTHWAQNLETTLTAELTASRGELAKCVALLDAAETTVEERTLWAQRLEAENQAIHASRWLRLGRRLGLGPSA